MKQVLVVVKPFLAERVLEALNRAPLEALHVREVKGWGRQKSYLEEYQESEYSMAFLPKVEISLWMDDSRAEEIIRKIVEAARTGRIGDGKIFVLGADSYERIVELDADRTENRKAAGGRQAKRGTRGNRKTPR